MEQRMTEKMSDEEIEVMRQWIVSLCRYGTRIRITVQVKEGAGSRICGAKNAERCVWREAMIDLDELTKLEQAATPAPWFVKRVE